MARPPSHAGSGPGDGVLAIDPGRHKCGVAVVGSDGSIRFRAVVERAKLLGLLRELVQRYPVRAVVVGRSAAGRELARELAAEPWVDGCGGVRWVEEEGSSWRARQLYWELHPPRGLWRWVPVGLRVPPQPWDDLAAVVLAWRFLGLAER